MHQKVNNSSYFIFPSATLTWHAKERKWIIWSAITLGRGHLVVSFLKTPAQFILEALTKKSFLIRLHPKMRLDVHSDLQEFVLRVFVMRHSQQSKDDSATFTAKPAFRICNLLLNLGHSPSFYMQNVWSASSNNTFAFFLAVFRLGRSWTNARRNKTRGFTTIAKKQKIIGLKLKLAFADALTSFCDFVRSSGAAE